MVDRRFDEAALARAQSLVGLKGYVTNVPVAVMPAIEVIAKYVERLLGKKMVIYLQV